MRTFAIIPAGGKGLRSGSSVPKQYLKINGKELIAYTLSTFQRSSLVNNIVIAAEKKFHNRLSKIIKENNFSKINLIIEGGKTRQNSVFNCIKKINADKEDLIIVHDAARPLLELKVLNNAINFAIKEGNAVVSIKAKDTLVVGNQFIKNYVDRNEINYLQTPQIFKYKDFLRAINYSERNSFVGTDESSLMKKIGKKIHLVEGSSMNIKITTKDDLKIFRSISQKGM
ncbi:MAG: 2-C-methyl-D-erythritol 4-phosphate cytidylyltransferase [Ignavibacteriales bacterium CG_4_9_14_3_um_filter_30_11]|nr:MAG: 2-C-methyl-D-erythritol 4-phosphate cytidylyltransferase [Ignavibacteriales bacterium CG_4_9_14_3_um_filter_30_11]